MPDIVFTRHEGKPDRAKLDVQEAVGYFEHLIGSKSRINHKRISGQMHRCGAQGATLVLKSDCRTVLEQGSSLNDADQFAPINSGY